MKRETKQQGIGRRQFLTRIGAGTAAGTAAVITAIAPTSTTASVAPADDDAYRETEHVLRYYDLASKF